MDDAQQPNAYITHQPTEKTESSERTIPSPSLNEFMVAAWQRGRTVAHENLNLLQQSQQSNSSSSIPTLSSQLRDQKERRAKNIYLYIFFKTKKKKQENKFDV